MNIQNIILNLDKSAIVNPPASEIDIEKCNKKLGKIGVPQLPSDYVEFLKNCNGMEFNGMQIFGTENNEIVHHTAQNQIYYEHFDEIKELLFFGRIDDDLYTYNAKTQKYEARDINGFDIWDEYESFEEFFSKEMMKWLV